MFTLPSMLNTTTTNISDLSAIAASRGQMIKNNISTAGDIKKAAAARKDAEARRIADEIVFEDFPEVDFPSITPTARGGETFEEYVIGEIQTALSIQYEQSFL